MFKNQILSNPAEMGRMLRGKGDRLLTSIESTSYLIISNSHHFNLNRQRQRKSRKTRRREIQRRGGEEKGRHGDPETINEEKEDSETEKPP